MENSSSNLFTAVHNDELQYSVWAIDRELPKGWHRVGSEASKQDCLKYIAEVWTDMRPLSLRLAIEEHSRKHSPVS